MSKQAHHNLRHQEVARYNAEQQLRHAMSWEEGYFESDDDPADAIKAPGVLDLKEVMG